MKTLGRNSLVSAALFGALAVVAPVHGAPILGADLASFTVLGASTVTNVPTSTIVGNVGVWSSGGANAITGFDSSPGVAVSDPQVTGGLVHAGTAEAESAQGQLTTARLNLSSLGPGTLLASDLTGLTLMPGIYTVPAGTTNLSGSVTLDGEGDANAAWIFQMPSTFITSPNSVVDVINTGDGAGLFWNVGSSATIDVNTALLGNILASQSITFNTSATDFCGRALAENGAVTLDQNSLAGTCQGPYAGTEGLSGGLDVTTGDDGIDVVDFRPSEPVTPGTPVTPVPEPGMLGLLGLGLLGIAAVRRRPR
jgi:hypothetical protein